MKEDGSCLKILIPAAGVFVGTLLWRAIESQQKNFSPEVDKLIYPWTHMRPPELIDFTPVICLGLFALGMVAFASFAFAREDKSKN